MSLCIKIPLQIRWLLWHILAQFRQWLLILLKTLLVYQPAKNKYIAILQKIKDTKLTINQTQHTVS